MRPFVRGRDTDGSFGLALKDFSEAVRLTPNYGLPHIFVGLTHMERNNLDGAVTAFSEAIKVGANSSELDFSKLRNVDVHSMRAAVHFRKGNKELAAADCRIALSRNPNDEICKQKK